MFIGRSFASGSSISVRELELQHRPIKSMAKTSIKAGVHDAESSVLELFQARSEPLIGSEGVPPLLTETHGNWRMGKHGDLYVTGDIETL